MSSTIRVRPTIGIDLGTTNSVIAVLDDTGTVLLTGQDQGKVTLPSVVGWDPDGKKLVAGREALDLFTRGEPSETGSLPVPSGPGSPALLPLSSVKRHVGLARRFPLGPESLSPEEVSAVILRQLRTWLEHTLAGSDPSRASARLLDRAIITMPAYFNHNQIEATRRAGELAGFDVVELLHEPTAAAIYYSWLHDHGDATYLVYDLGGGTFDVSVIRRRLGDHEVLAVSGDPFLGGDDFDRLLATHLVEAGTWKAGGEPFDPAALFDPTQPDGAVPFARLVRLAEQVKIDLTTEDAAERYVPRVLTLPDGRELSLEARVTRQTFDRLIRDKVARTIDCCQEALARAKERADLSLSDIDHVVLVGGSSRIPLVRQVVRSAFASRDLAEHVRSCELLLHEPDLCVAYGAALRAASHGMRYLLPDAAGELHLRSPASLREPTYQAAGVVYLADMSPEGVSVRIRALSTGLVEEVFLDRRGGFSQELELEPDSDNRFEWTLCDADGQPFALLTTTVRHQSTGRSLGQGVLPTQLITRPLSIEVLTRGRQRTRQVVAPAGATLPGTFRCTCRTSDQSGRIVVPIYEDSRTVKQLVIEDLDPNLPVGSPVDVEFDIDVKHTIEVRVHVKGGAGQSGRTESATIEPPPPPRRPTRAEIEEVGQQLDAVLEQLAGRQRSRVRARAGQIRKELLEALSYDDEPRAIQRMAEYQDLASRAEMARDQMLDPPWPRFAQLVRQCLDLAADVAAQTGRDRDELMQHVHAQERYAEEAHEDLNQALYRECFENLDRYAGYLGQLLRDSLPRPTVRPSRPPQEEAKAEMEHFRARLSVVWRQAKAARRDDLDSRLAGIAKQASGLGHKMKDDPVGVVRELRALLVEIDKAQQQMEKPAPRSPSDPGGLLEGSS